jgi:hypothetical protein
MAHAHDLGDGRHGQARAVGGPDSVVSLLPQFLAGLLPRGLALGVALGKGGQIGSGLRGLAFWSGDPLIV